MSHHNRTVTGYMFLQCNKCGKKTALFHYNNSPTGRDYRAPYGEWTVGDRLLHTSVKQGWRIYDGRSRRFYCQNCGPTRNHKMQEVTHYWQAGE